VEGLDPIYVYDRMGEPNNDMLSKALALAEGGDCAVTFATGMAAVHAAVTCTLPQHAEIIAHRTLYGCTYSLFNQWLPRFGLPVHFTDLRDTSSIASLVNDNTRVVYLESPVNPSLELVDIKAIADTVRDINSTRSADRQIITIIDNTFCTPFSQRPITLGIDMVVHSLTKGISGFGIEMGGAVITRREFLTKLIMHRKDFGGTLSPSTAWSLLVHGLPTLSLRRPSAASFKVFHICILERSFIVT
jgi:cystathionine beta-lyase/cystathionine gamma-synthase